MKRSWPPPTLKHLCRLTDDCGVIQHAKFWLPDYSTGYCVDDNSRALIVARNYYQLFGDEVAHELMVRYLAFIFYVQRGDGKVRNFIDYSRNFLEEEGSPDSLGRTLWALGHITTIGEEYLSVPAQEMFHRALAHLAPDMAAHALAYGTLGLCAYSEHPDRQEEARRLVRPLVARLLALYRETSSDDWQWFLSALTYANPRLAQAMLHAGQLLDNMELIDVGLESLHFLNTVLYREGLLMPVGCHGWYPRGGHCAVFDQQPIDAGSAAEANLAAYRLTGEARYLDYAGIAMDWFYGLNIHRMPVYNAQSGGCYDGLQAAGINANQGAESTLAYLMATLQLYQVVPHLYELAMPEEPEESDKPMPSWKHR